MLVRCVSGPLHNKYVKECGRQFKYEKELYVKVFLEPKFSCDGPNFVEYFSFNHHVKVLCKGDAIKYCCLGCLGYTIIPKNQ